MPCFFFFCSLRISDDGRTLTCQPETPFAASEVVTVETDTTAARWTGPTSAGKFVFTIAGNAVNQGVLWKRRGDNLPAAVSSPPRPGKKGLTIADSDVVLPNITVTVSGVTSPGNIFLSPNISITDSVPALLILKNDGTPVFARNLPDNAYDFKPQPNGMLTYYDNVSSTCHSSSPTEIPRRWLMDTLFRNWIRAKPSCFSGAAGITTR